MRACLDLSKNAIAEIANDTFDNLSQLISLDLSLNQIKALHKNTFKPLTKLYALYLNGNQLQTIDPDLLFHNSVLWYIDLRNNDLRIIKDSFRMLVEILTSLVDGNPNLESIDLPHMAEYMLHVNISNCNLKTLFIPQNVVKLFATNNQISSIRIHPNQKLAEIIDISHNNLTDIANISDILLEHVSYLNIMYNNFRDADYTQLCHRKHLETRFNVYEITSQKFLFVTFPKGFFGKRNISRSTSVYISSRNLSSEQQMKVVSNCEPCGINMHINDHNSTYNPYR